MDNYNYHKGMKGIIQELKVLLKTKSIGTGSDRALLLDFQAALETKSWSASDFSAFLRVILLKFTY